MTDFDSAMRPWKALMDSLQPYTGIRRAFIGNGAGTVDVDSMPGWSWIRYDESQSKLSMVRNPAFGLLPDGVPVIVGKRHHTDDYEQILYVDFAYWYDMSDAERIQYRVPPHGISHGGAIGSDPAPIDLNNISYGKVVPTDPASLSVLIYPFIYSNSLSVILYAGETLDLTASVPVGAGHRYVLVYLDQSTGAAGFVNGTVVGIPAPAIPVPDAIAGTYPLAIVELTNGQATILISDIAQWKLPWCVVGGTIGPHTHSDDSSGGTSIIGLEEFMFACHTPLFLVGAHVWPTEVYHELYIPVMYDGLNLEADLIWIHPDPVDGCGQILILKVADPGLYSTYKINVRHGIGNIWLSGGDVVLDEGTDHLWLIYNGEYWCNDVGRIAAGVTGSGVANQVAYWTAANTIDGDAGFTYDPVTDTITVGAIDVASGGDIDPADASGQDLGDATHRWDLYTQEVYFGGASGANVITVPDNLADALHIIDDGDANDYLTFVTANAQREVVFNQDGADIDTRIEAVGKTNALFVQGSDGLVGFGRIPTAQVDIAAAAAAGWALQTSFDNSGNCWRMWRAGLFSATIAQVAGTAFNLANNASYITGAWAFDGLDTKSALKMVLDAWSGNFLFDIAPANPAGAPVFDTKVAFKHTGDVGMGVAVGAIAAKLHVDQSSASGAQPVLLLDQADVSEQCIKYSSDGVDRDIQLFTIDVTGTPTMQWDETEDALNWNKAFNVGDFAGGNYATIESDGTVEFNGDATVWNDIYFPMSSGKIGGVNQPTWAAFQGNTMEYTFAINDYIHLPAGEIAHSYKQGSDIKLHVHIVLDGSDVGDTDVNYEIEYTIGDMNEVMSAAVAVTSGDYTITGGTADRTHLFIQVGTIAGAAFLIRAALKMRFRRIVLVGAGNAPSNDPYVLMVGVHIEEDTVGSRTETAK